MKASIRDAKNTHESSTENANTAKSKDLYEFEDEQAEYARLEAERRKPYEEVIDFITGSPAMKLNFTNDKGDDESDILTVETLLNWEENHTNIYMSTIGDAPIVYIWRVFNRFEYLKTLGDAVSAAKVDWDNDKQRQDYIISKCLLFPNPSLYFRNTTPAGVVPTLEKQILYKSGFVPEAEALNSINIIG